jgi:hypothetical protein
LFEPTLVSPVPPLVIGNAVPEYPIVIEGVDVGFVTVTLKKEGTDAETLVTVPVVNVDQEVFPAPSVISACPLEPVVRGNVKFASPVNLIIAL